MPLYWVGKALAFLSICFDAWSPICLVAGALIAIAIREAIDAANANDEANDEMTSPGPKTKDL
jgi:hypothetical protein